MKNFNLVYIRSGGTIFKEPILCESKYFIFTYEDWLSVSKKFNYDDEIQYMSSIYLGEFDNFDVASEYLRKTDEKLKFFTFMIF